ncbi:MAG: hypothetical protein AABW46_01585 [Nanoarchaeota archaeon]
MNRELVKIWNDIKEGSNREQRLFSDAWKEFKRIIDKKTKISESPPEFKKFNGVDGKFSLELNCMECRDKFVQEFSIGDCPKCRKIFDDKIKIKMEERRKKHPNDPEWIHTLSAWYEIWEEEGKIPKV